MLHGSRKIPPGKIPTHETPPLENCPRKFPPEISPPISLIVFLHLALRPYMRGESEHVHRPLWTKNFDISRAT